MTDDELGAWWPELRALVAGLRRHGQVAVADRLIDAVRGGATGSEVLGRIGVVLRGQRALRATLDADTVHAWKSVMAAVDRAFPGEGFRDWLTRLFVRG